MSTNLRHRRTHSISNRHAVTASLLLSILAGSAFATTGNQPDQSVAGTSTSTINVPIPDRQRRQPHGPVSALDGRINLMAKELNLDSGQQTELRKILLIQRAQIAHVWNDETVPAPLRVQATQKISEHTSEQIRALLNEEQRKRYNKPVPKEFQARRGDPEKWMQNGSGPQSIAVPAAQP